MMDECRPHVADLGLNTMSTQALEQGVYSYKRVLALMETL
jgi:hypothetical protein